MCTLFLFIGSETIFLRDRIRNDENKIKHDII